jgi:hypothetical protein
MNDTFEDMAIKNPETGAVITWIKAEDIETAVMIESVFIETEAEVMEAIERTLGKLAEEALKKLGRY